MRASTWTTIGVLAPWALGCGGAGGPAPEAEPAAPAAPAAQAPTDCAAVGDIRFICDLVSPEDLAVVPGAEWVIASGNQAGGKLHLIDVQEKTATVLFPSPAAGERLDAAAYPDCPGPIDPAEGDAFRAHGLYLAPGADAVHTLYLVHHGHRESVEVFELDAGAGPPALTWIGCAVAPELLRLNSVVALPDGGFAATSFRTAGLTASFDEVLAGAVSGSVWEWRAGEGWTVVPGSATAGPNGLEISGDGQWFHVAAWGGQQFIRLSRGRTPIEREAVDLHFRPDNLRRQTDGSVLAAGADHFDTPDETFHVARIDPQTLTVERVIDHPVIDRFAACTTAMQIGGEIWMGTNRGEKIGYFPAP